jgi:arylsulfatase
VGNYSYAAVISCAPASPSPRRPHWGGTATSSALARSDERIAPARPPASKPNIVLILADNVGYGVLSCYNGGILDTPTPCIDKLAAEGLRLTNFNVENQCTPSRAALMTGRLPIRCGIGKAIAAGAPGGLHPREITLAEMLGDAGYRTAIYGKWHLGVGEGRLPTDQGFDEWFGFETSDIIYWTGKPGTPALKDVDYIREAKKGEKPRNVRVYDENTRRQIDRIDQVPHYGREDPAAETGAEDVQHKLESIPRH